MIPHQLAEDDVMVDIQTFCPECGFDTETVPLSSLSYADYPHLFEANLERVTMLGPGDDQLHHPIRDEWFVPENPEFDRHGRAA